MRKEAGGTRIGKSPTTIHRFVKTSHQNEKRSLTMHTFVSKMVSAQRVRLRVRTGLNAHLALLLLTDPSKLSEIAGDCKMHTFLLSRGQKREIKSARPLLTCLVDKTKQQKSAPRLHMR
jgi:hypothetical protein